MTNNPGLNRFCNGSFSSVGPGVGNIRESQRIPERADSSCRNPGAPGANPHASWNHSNPLLVPYRPA